MDEATLHRRVLFLLAEAAVVPPPNDQSIKMTLRVISNVVGCGRDVSSQRYKDLTRYMSKNALKLRRDLGGDKKTFYNQTINEHPDELDDVWNWLKKSHGELTVQSVLERFHRWPMVVITKKENDELRPLKGKGPEARYANIEVHELVGDEWVLRRDPLTAAIAPL